MFREGTGGRLGRLLLDLAARLASDLAAGFAVLSVVVVAFARWARTRVITGGRLVLHFRRGLFNLFNRCLFALRVVLILLVRLVVIFLFIVVALHSRRLSLFLTDLDRSLFDMVL